MDDRKVMTPEEFAAAMQLIHDRHKGEFNLECVHLEMDAQMVNLLRSLGYGKGCDIFKEQEKWYA